MRSFRLLLRAMLLSAALLAPFGAAADRTAIVSRYSGHSDFRSRTELSWKESGGKFSSGRSIGHITIVNGEECSSLLEQQAAAFARMLEVGYLTREQIKVFQGLASQLSPEQVTFFEMARPRGSFDVKANGDKEFSWDTSARTFSHYDQSSNETLDITATLWSVAGQTWRPKYPNIERMALPWMLEEGFKEQAMRYPRNKYPWMWEWGRISQLLPDESLPLRAMTAATNYLELRAMGGKLEHAWVTFHSLDRAHNIVYSQEFPGTRDGQIFVVPLAQALEKYPIEKYSKKVARLIEASRGTLNRLTALDLIQDFQKDVWSELDFYDPAMGRQKGPIVIYDMFSRGLDRKTYVSSAFAGVPEEHREAVGRVLQTEFFRAREGMPIGQYHDLTDPFMSDNHYGPRAAVEFTNFSPELAKKDPDYVPLALLATFDQYLDDIAGVPEYRKVNLEQLRGINQMFGVSTLDVSIAAQLAKLSPSDVATDQMLMEVSPWDLPHLGRDGFVSRAAVKPLMMFFFSVEDIMRIAQQYKDLVPRAGVATTRNSWQRQWHLSNPDIF